MLVNATTCGAYKLSGPIFAILQVGKYELIIRHCIINSIWYTISQCWGPWMHQFITAMMVDKPSKQGASWMIITQILMSQERKSKNHWAMYWISSANKTYQIWHELHTFPTTHKTPSWALTISQDWGKLHHHKKHHQHHILNLLEISYLFTLVHL